MKLDNYSLDLKMKILPRRWNEERVSKLSGTPFLNRQAIFLDEHTRYASMGSRTSLRRKHCSQVRSGSFSLRCLCRPESDEVASSMWSSVSITSNQDNCIILSA